MATKESRAAAIKRLVRTGRFSTQGRLLAALRKKRLDVDQSTLSRDLAELGIRKSGGRYVLPKRERAETRRLDYSSVVHGLTACGPHLIVITAEVGQAQAVAVAIDEKADPSIVATLAGDDTIFVATTNRRTQAVAQRRLEQWFGEKHEC
ncbi:MAG: hypothetical protein IID38_05960 [Planctomycetes bacterium]|nr:hypothetical protein [Planctomycetota bacterium]